MIADIMKKFSTPIMRLMYTFVDIMAKLSGIFTLVVNGLYATFLAIKSIIARILMDLVIVVTTLCILIAILWLIPFIGWAKMQFNSRCCWYNSILNCFNSYC